jgi:hypothetical protein
LAGVALATVGLAWLSRLSPTGNYVNDVLGGSVLATLGLGLSMTPLAFAATAGVAREEAGLASGLLNTSRQVGGSVALAALATIAAARTAAVLHPHGPAVAAYVGRAAMDRALTSGFNRVFLVSAFIAFGGFLAALLIPRQPAAGAAQAAKAAAPVAVE